jgi:hypothetical protein
MNLSKEEQEYLYRIAPFYKVEGKEDFPVQLYGDKELEQFVSYSSDQDLKVLKDKLRMINDLAGKYWIQHRKDQRLVDFMDYRGSSSYPISETDKHIYNKKRFLVGKEVPLIPIFSKLQYWENAFNKAVNPPAMELIQKQCLKWIEKIEMRQMELNLHTF